MDIRRVGIRISSVGCILVFLVLPLMSQVGGKFFTCGYDSVSMASSRFVHGDIPSLLTTDVEKDATALGVDFHAALRIGELRSSDTCGRATFVADERRRGAERMQDLRDIILQK